MTKKSYKEAKKHNNVGMRNNRLQPSLYRDSIKSNIGNQAIRLIENTSTAISPKMKKEKAKIIQWQNIREKNKLKAN